MQIIGHIALNVRRGSFKIEPKRRKKLRKAMGKCQQKQDDKLRMAADRIIPLRETLREDYEFYMEDDGTFTASYDCHCDVCGFRHEFKHEEEIDLTE